jgi:hypothetical protein
MSVGLVKLKFDWIERLETEASRKTDSIAYILVNEGFPRLAQVWIFRLWNSNPGFLRSQIPDPKSGTGGTQSYLDGQT